MNQSAQIFELHETVSPHSLTLEQAVLAGAMAESEGWDAISDILSEVDFFSPRHAIIFTALKALYSSGKAVDPLIISDWLKLNGLHNRAGGDETLSTILRDSPATSVNSSVYAKRIRELSVLRHLLKAADEIKAEVMNPEGLSAEELLSRAESRVLAVSSAKEGIGAAIPMHNTASVLNDVFDEIGRNMNRAEGELSGITTGFASLDKKTDGLQRGDMVVIGARPSMGKTTLGMNLVESALFAIDLPVVVFSMESPSRQIGQRLLSSVANVPFEKIRRGIFEGPEFTAVSRATRDLKERKIIICDKGALTPNDMRSVLRRVAREHGGVGMIMADYVQKMRPNIPGKRTRNDELTEISNDLKAMAMDYNCPFIVLSQLSKECERRPNKRPMNSDLRDCGGIEQDADLIIMLYRDEVYNPLKTEAAGLAELILTKNRNGETGTIVTRFIGSHFQFRDIA